MLVPAVPPAPLVAPVTVLPPEDQPPAGAQPNDEWWYFGVIGGMGLLCLLAQAFVFTQNRDDWWVGLVGAALVSLWLYANTQDTTKWQANPGPTDRRTR